MADREIVFVFPTTHNALAGEKALLMAGIDVRIMTRPASLGEGCGICIRIDENHRDDAEDALRDNDVSIGGIYLKHSDAGKTVYEEAARSDAR
ncbi:MAG: DUF3343 domain-containing protein [Planctomycetes bacterium]|nr:DUF3343 domain-containing protein [Planctomycetota bacterium]MCD7895534.1 DUF3343 domain-containing protein [Planctomycetaceae bacterium]